MMWRVFCAYRGASLTPQPILCLRTDYLLIVLTTGTLPRDGEERGGEEMEGRGEEERRWRGEERMRGDGQEMERRWSG